MLRFDGQDDFEAWLRACPLGQRRLSYAVTRSGVDGILSVQCCWRMPACAAPARPKEKDAAPAHTSDLREEAAGATDGKADEIAALRANLERMRGFVAAGGRGGPPAGLMGGSSAGGADPGDPPAGLVADVVESSITGGGTAGSGGGSDEKARGEAALAAMMQARASGASTREQVRAGLSMGLGGLQFPKPPGSGEDEAPVASGGVHSSPEGREGGGES
jgi:hypothetical protein